MDIVVEIVFEFFGELLVELPLSLLGRAHLSKRAAAVLKVVVAILSVALFCALAFGIALLFDSRALGWVFILPSAAYFGVCLILYLKKELKKQK